jgi:hypothetical protein
MAYRHFGLKVMLNTLAQIVVMTLQSLLMLITLNAYKPGIPFQNIYTIQWCFGLLGLQEITQHCFTFHCQ